MFSYYTAIKLELDKFPWVKKKIMNKIKTYLEQNDNEGTTCQKCVGHSQSNI